MWCLVVVSLITLTGGCPVASKATQKVGGVQFFSGGRSSESEWRRAVATNVLQLAEFPTTSQNVLLATEVDALSAHSHKYQDVDLGLTFLALKTGLPISFSLDQGNDGSKVQQKTANQFHNGSLHIGGHDISDNDDFGMSFQRQEGSSAAPFDVFAFGMHLIGNDLSDGEKLNVYR